MSDLQELEELRRLDQLESKATGSMSIADRAARVAGLGARAAIRGVTAIPTLAAEAVAAPLRYATGGKYFPSPSATFEQTMTSAGLPEPSTPIERVSTDIAGSMAGMGTQLGALGRMAQPGNIAETLTQQPVRQLVASGMGGGASSVTSESGVGPLGQTIAGAAGSMLPFAPQMVAPRPTPEALRSAQVAQRGRQAGYVLPPATAVPSFPNKFLEGISGKVQTAQAATIKNAAVTDNLIKKDFGIPPNEAVTSDRLSSIRRAAGTNYQNIENFGVFKTDPQFANDLNALSATQQVLYQEVPELANKNILGLVGSLNKPEFSGRTLIELTKTLREKATSAFRAGDSGEGRFYRGTAEAVENMIERNLTASGQTDMLNRFRNARTLIAKTYTAEAALNEATGNFSARKLASQMDAGKPLSGGMKTAGEFSLAFPRATQPTEAMGSPPGVSIFDLYGAGLGGGIGMAATRSPYGAAFGLLPLIRPATRSLIMSQPYQNIMASPVTSPLGRSEAGLLGLMPNLYTQ
jgi:hypothetical protein